MSVLEIIGGSLLIIVSLAIIFFVTIQTEHGEGISGAIMGTSSGVAGKSGSNEEKLARLTRILGFVFFALALLGNIFVLIANKAA